jgi:dTDP-4-amino-4,6-dideoxygalactose transaminase
MQPCFKEIMVGQKPKQENSIDSYNRGICLPSFAALKQEEIEYVCNTIKEYLEK